MEGTVRLTSFLETLPEEKLEGLYDNQWTCQAVFRSLPPLAKQLCLRLTFLDVPVSESGIPYTTYQIHSLHSLD